MRTIFCSEGRSLRLWRVLNARMRPLPLADPCDGCFLFLQGHAVGYPGGRELCKGQSDVYPAASARRVSRKLRISFVAKIYAC